MNKKKKKNKLNKYELNKYDYFEFVDRAHTINVMVHQLLFDHPVLKKHKKLLKRYNKAGSELGDLYVDASELFFDLDEKL